MAPFPLYRRPPRVLVNPIWDSQGKVTKTKDDYSLGHTK